MSRNLERRAEILRQMSEGKSLAQIALDLNCSASAVKNMVSRMRDEDPDACPPGRDERNRAAVIKLWGEGKSTIAIARKIGITKNAVIGLARRIRAEFPDLCPRRESPIRPLASGAVRKARKSYAERKAIAERNKAARAGSETPYSPQFAGVVRLKAPTPKPIAFGTVSKCCWPLWADAERSGGINAQFCCEPTLPGRSWCPTHYAVCFTPSSRQQANAA